MVVKELTPAARTLACESRVQLWTVPQIAGAERPDLHIRAILDLW